MRFSWRLTSSSLSSDTARSTLKFRKPPVPASPRNFISWICGICTFVTGSRTVVSCGSAGAKWKTSARS